MPDNYIDGLAKDNLGNHEVDFNPGDWDKMEKLLDEKDKKPAGLFTWQRMVAAAALTGIAVLISIWAFNRNQPVNGISGVDKEPDRIEQKGIVETDQTPTLKTESRPLLAESEIGDITGTEINDLNQSEIGSENSDQPKYAETVNRSEINNPVSEKTSVNNKLIKDPAITIVPVTANVVQEPAGEGQIINNSSPTLIDKESALTLVSLKKTDPLLAENPFSHRMGLDNQLHKPKKGRQLFWIGTTLTPALNVVDKAKFGFSAGITGGIKISNTFSLETGLLYTRFNYSENPGNIPVENYIVTNTDAQLKYLDIPLILNYTIPVQPRLNVYVSGGLSNFFPIKETYNFSFEANPNATPPNNLLQDFSSTTTVNTVGAIATPDNLAVQGTTTKNEVYNLSSNDESAGLKAYQAMGQLGSGIEYRLKPGSSVQAGIVYSFPLSGYGVENKKIQSIGLRLGMKFFLGKP